MSKKKDNIFEFKCPLCGCNISFEILINSLIPSSETVSYETIKLYKCFNCSLIFGDVNKISKVDIPRQVKLIEQEKELEQYKEHWKS